MEVSVVIPCLNEAETVGTCIAKAFRALDAEHIDGEVIVSDNGSTDGSQKSRRTWGRGYLRSKRGAMAMH